MYAKTLLLAVLLFPSIALCQRLKWEYTLQAPQGSFTDSDVANEGRISWDGLGGCAFAVDYYDEIGPPSATRIFWLTAAKKDVVFDVPSIERVVILKVTPSSLVVLFDESKIVRKYNRAGAVKDISLTPSGLLLDVFTNAQRPDHVGYFVIKRNPTTGAPFSILRYLY